ncbi:unnamed protein product [Nippostrongylus brasiliensis]|uniref:XK-related protein n=1 Tax=Nippostrongylus brasiliensis TaxID=27835 RepID=A0A0N4Y6W9_NIPBR|nr:unnamed protein product [Nippostrongylus brasiliensis]
MDLGVALNGILFGWLLTFWLAARLIDVNVPITSIPSHRLRGSIATSGPFCPYSLTVEEYWRKGLREQVSIEGGRGTLFLFREKMLAVASNLGDAAAVVQWFLQQIRVDHLIMEVLLCEHIWNAPPGYVEEMKANEASYIFHITRKFAVEKVLVLAYVIVRNVEKDQFIITRTLLASTTVVITVEMMFLIRIVGLRRAKRKSRENEESKTKDEPEPTNNVEEDDESKKSEEEIEEDPHQTQILPRRLLVLLMACFFAATTMTSFGVTSFKVIHPLYSAMITVEGVILLVRCLFVIYRVAGWQVVRDRSGQKEAIMRKLYAAKRLTDVLVHCLSAIQYALYLVVGAIINGKLFALVFVTRLSHHLYRLGSNVYDHFCGRETSVFMD